MTTYENMTSEQLAELKATLETQYAGYQEKNLSLNMARGKPGADQLDLSIEMLTLLKDPQDFFSDDGTDCRNYGVLDGLPEAKAMMGYILDEDPANVIVCGNSSLNIMFDTLMHHYAFGSGGHAPWCKQENVKWLCPCPGYDRHFSLTENLGFENIVVPLLETGPDMDIVEKLVAEDPTIKGIWCVPKYSNPTGIVYSDETVERLGKMETAAPDFRIFWDNAYAVHYLYDEPEMQDSVADIGAACRKYGHNDRYLKFGSTSKITLPGSGIAAFAACPEIIEGSKAAMSIQTIGHDKLNMLRHVRFLQDPEGIAAHMSKHAAIIRPKFELVLSKLAEGLKGTGASWVNPRGGYFVSFEGYPGTAKRTVTLAKEAGVVMTGAGATYPGKKDPQDSNIRIAPTFPPLEELEVAMDVFVCCNKIATIEAILAQRA